MTRPILSPVIKVLDDDKDQHRAISRAIQSPYTCQCYDSQEGLFSGPAPELFICDLRLGQTSGLEVLNRAKTEWPETARILISGFLTEDDLSETINRDLAHRVLRKPWNVNDLRMAISEGLATARLLKDRKYWQELSLTDPLTHLWNRRALLQQLVRESSRTRRHHRPYTLVMIDIDHFKRINDERGHLHGDEVLRRLARLMVESVRAIDWVYRFGGDEFAVLLPETRWQEGKEIAERLRVAAQTQLNLNLSLGLAEDPSHTQDPGELIGIADRALYTAKTQGRSQCAVAPLEQIPLI